MNTMKTFLLLAVLTALFGGAGYALGGERGMVMALLLAVFMNLFAYWNADRIVLSMYNARPLIDGPVVRIVRELAAEARLPMPKVYIIDTPQPNAFATGRNPEHAAVAVTRGILDALDEREIRAVLAHEMTHIRNHDTLTMTITATIAGALSTLANFAMFFGASRDRRSNPLGTLALVIFAPLAALLVQLAISRTREYAADEGGAGISHDPDALADALSKIQRAAAQVPNDFAEAHPATAHMFIVNPLLGGGFDSLFATHPPVTRRIEILRQLARRPS